MVQVANQLPFVAHFGVMLKMVDHFLAITAAQQFVLEAAVGLVPSEMSLIALAHLHPILSLA